MARSSRRTLMGSSATMLLLAPFAAGSGKAAELDGELIALCRQFEAAEAEAERLRRIADIVPSRASPEQITAAAEANTARDELLYGIYGELMDRIAELPARTPEGLRAKAELVHAFYYPDPPEDGCGAGAVLWSLICELAGRAE